MAPACPILLPEGDDRLGIGARVMLHQVVSSLLLSFSTDLSDHDDALGGRVLDEQLQAVDEVCTVEGVATNTNT